MSSKILTLAGLALALTSLAAPAAAQAGPFWWEDDTKKGEILLTETKEAGPQPELTFTVEGLKIGPCSWGPDNQWAGFLFNDEEEGGEGVFNEGSFENPCPTSLMGCTADVTPKGFPWPLKATEEEGPVVDLIGVSFHAKFTGTCALLGETTASGDIGGVFDNDNSLITYNETGGLTANGKEVKVDGSIAFGTLMTLK